MKMKEKMSKNLFKNLSKKEEKTKEKVINKKLEKEKKIKEPRRKENLVDLREIFADNTAAKEIFSMMFDPSSDVLIDLNDPKYRALKRAIKQNEKMHEKIEEKWLKQEHPEDDTIEEDNIIQDDNIKSSNNEKKEENTTKTNTGKTISNNKTNTTKTTSSEKKTATNNASKSVSNEKATTKKSVVKTSYINERSEYCKGGTVGNYKSVDDYIIKDSYNNIFEFDDTMLQMNLDDAYREFKDQDPREVKLMICSILYIGMIIDIEGLLHQCINNEDLIYCNSLIKFYTGMVTLPNVSVYGINEVVNLNLLEKVVRWEASYRNNFTELTSISDIVDKTASAIMNFKKKEMEAHGQKDPDPVRPLFFNSNNLEFNPNTPERGIRLDKATLIKLEKAFGPVLDGFFHEFTRDSNSSDLGWLHIYNDSGKNEWYRVEFGQMRGNEFNILLPSPYGNIYVNFRKKTILRKLFNYPNYQLTPEELSSLKSVEFNNSNIYYIVDMSNTNRTLKNLSAKDMNKLGKKLSFIINWDYGKIPMSRLRFEYFKSIDNFSLVSDKKCNCPIPNECCPTITEGLRFKVKGDEVTAFIRDKYSETKVIQNYNVL